MRELPLLPVTTVGSWPRPHDLLVAQKRARMGQISEEEFQCRADEAVLRALRMQEEAGADIVTDGEQRRDNFVSFVAKRLDGVELLTLGEILGIIEDKVAFERILQTLDVPSYAISNATCTGPVRRRGALGGGRSEIPEATHGPRREGGSARPLHPHPFAVRAGGDPPPLRREGGPGRGRRGPATGGGRGADRGGSGLHPVRRARADRARVHPGPDAHLHVRGPGRPQGPGRGARVRRLPAQSRHRGLRGRPLRPSCLPRKLEP